MTEPYSTHKKPHLLRTLWQGIKRAWFACRNDEFTCTFRSGFEQGGRLDLRESILYQVLSHGVYDEGSKTDIPLKLLASKIQISISQSNFFIWLFFVQHVSSTFDYLSFVFTRAAAGWDGQKGSEGDAGLRQ